MINGIPIFEQSNDVFIFYFNEWTFSRKWFGILKAGVVWIFAQP